jgi:hypothetical protein
MNDLTSCPSCLLRKYLRGMASEFRHTGEGRYPGVAGVLEYLDSGLRRNDKIRKGLSGEKFIGFHALWASVRSWPTSW